MSVATHSTLRASRPSAEALHNIYSETRSRIAPRATSKEKTVGIEVQNLSKRVWLVPGGQGRLF